MPSTVQSRLAALLVEQQELEARLHALDASPGRVLAVGEALLRFAAREDEAFSSLAPLLDPAAQRELATEHQAIADDLGLLEWLVNTTPDSADVSVLAASLARRMQQHVDRDGRLLARSVGLPPRP